jgi:hypothetical protein
MVPLSGGTGIIGFRVVIGIPETALAGFAPLWQAVGMAKKRTKADKAQRQSNQLEKRADTRPEQTPKKPQASEDFSQVAARIVMRKS